MEKGTVFQFTASNGATGIKAVVLNRASTLIEGITDRIIETHLCYGQNRLFYVTMIEEIGGLESPVMKVGDIIVDYCVIPEYDSILENM